jgi:hypothetical protein
MDNNPGKAEALARAHEMRAMHENDDVPVESIAALFRYTVWTVKTMLAWHRRLYPKMPPYIVNTDAGRAFALEYLQGGRIEHPPEPRTPPKQGPIPGNPAFLFYEEEGDDEDERDWRMERDEDDEEGEA